MPPDLVVYPTFAGFENRQYGGVCPTWESQVEGKSAEVKSRLQGARENRCLLKTNRKRAWVDGFTPLPSVQEKALCRAILGFMTMCALKTEGTSGEEVYYKGSLEAQ